MKLKLKYKKAACNYANSVLQDALKETPTSSFVEEGEVVVAPRKVEILEKILRKRKVSYKNAAIVSKTLPATLSPPLKKIKL